jgi:two-component system, NarL family, response regulator DevR
VSVKQAARIRVLIVDDHEMVREGLMAMLQPEADFEVVGQTGRGVEVADLVETTRPDVVLLDARLPDLSGVEVCRRLSLSHPDVSVVILTTYTDPDLVQECIEAGARGYVVKDVERFSLKESIRAVYRGLSVLAPQVAGQVMEGSRAREQAGSRRAALSASQVAILRLISRGHSNREIAAEVHLSENTVKTHVQEIFRKLGVRNRVEAAILAGKSGWL